jgi:hypothetical protein
VRSRHTELVLCWPGCCAVAGTNAQVHPHPPTHPSHTSS